MVRSFAPDFDTRVQQSLRALWFLDPGRWVGTVAVGACAPTCVAQTFPLELFAPGPLPPPYADAPWCVDGVHVCSAALCASLELPAAIRAALHARQVTDEGRGRVACATSGAHWCPRHARMHVCTAQCTLSIESPHGARVCVLSGAQVAAALESDFESGTMLVDGSLAHQLDVTLQERRIRQKRRRITHVDVETALDAGTDTGVSSSARVVGYVDLDEPSHDLFPESLEGNTFGDAAAEDLARLYTIAYAVIRKLLGSPERDALEAAKRAAVEATSRRKIAQYVASVSPGEPVFVHTMERLYYRELGARRPAAQVVLPRNGLQRLHAYFAMIAVEFYAQVLIELERPGVATPEHAVGINNFCSLRFSSVVYVIYRYIANGCYLQQTAVIVPEPLLMYPEASQLEQLGMPQRTFTDAEKSLAYCLRLLWNSDNPIVAIQTTQLSMTTVLYQQTSVVATFLAARRVRTAQLRDNSVNTL